MQYINRSLCRYLACRAEASAKAERTGLFFDKLGVKNWFANAMAHPTASQKKCFHHSECGILNCLRRSKIAFSNKMPPPAPPPTFPQYAEIGWFCDRVK